MLTESPPFSTFLRAARDSLIDALEEQYRSRPDLRRPIAPEILRRGIATILDIFLAALDEDGQETIQQKLPQVLRAREAEAEPASVAQSVAGLALLHRALLGRAREAAEQGIPGTWEGIARLATIHTAVVAAVVMPVVEERGKAVLALAASERRYETLYRRAPVMMHSTDTELRLREVSDRWLEIMGYTREEVIGRSGRDFATEATRNLSLTSIAPDFFRTGSCKDIHYQYVKKSGEVVDLLLSAVLERDAEGRPAGAISVLVDVTDRLKAERALRESEERYRNLVEHAPLAVIVLREGALLYANPAALGLFGATAPAELLSKPATERLHPEDRPAVLVRFAMTSGESHVPLQEMRLIRLDGSSFEAEATASQIGYEGQSAIQIFFTDISARKQSEAALKRAALQEETIRAQEETMLALSTPLIPVSERVLVMPLVGRINEARAGRILEAVLAGVAAQRATHAILDVTGVPEADAGVADALLRAARSVRLLGAQVILTGIQPTFARTLVELDVHLEDIVTRGTLASGITYALAGPRAEAHA